MGKDIAKKYSNDDVELAQISVRAEVVCDASRSRT